MRRETEGRGSLELWTFEGPFEDVAVLVCSNGWVERVHNNNGIAAILESFSRSNRFILQLPSTLPHIPYTLHLPTRSEPQALNLLFQQINNSVNPPGTSQ